MAAGRRGAGSARWGGALRAWACALITALALCFTVRAAASDPPRRVVSLNPCLDTILVEIASREQIAALSFQSRDPEQSVLFEVARRYPVTFETAEEVVALQPDLVLSTRHSSLATRNALQRVGIRLVVLDVPESVESSLKQIRKVAQAIGREAAGDALIARLQASIRAARDAVRPSDRREPTEIPALIFQPSGFTPGMNTVIGDLMRVVGFANIAPRYGVKRWGIVGLEQIIADPPRLLLVGEVAPGAPTWAERKIRHPALRHLAVAPDTSGMSAQGNDRRQNTSPTFMARATFPARLLYCGGPVIEPALRSLIAARREFESTGGTATLQRLAPKGTVTSRLEVRR